MNITLFGAARVDPECKEYLDAIEIGRIVARKGHTLLNGGYGGLMKASAQGVSEENGHSIGITCKSFSYTKANQYIKQTLISTNIFDRLEMLICNSDAFIVCVGGIGTLSELTLALHECKNVSRKIYLIGDFWKWILDLEMIPDNCKSCVHVVTDINQLELLL